MSAYHTIKLPIVTPEDSIIPKWYRWLDILNAADDSPALANTIKQAETIYALIKEEKT